MNGVIIVTLILTILIFLGFVGIVALCIICGGKDSKKDDTILDLRKRVEANNIRYGMLNEAFIEYRAMNPIKARYRVNAPVYIIENKKPYKGVVVEVHQNQAHEITYTISYTEWKSTSTKTVVKEQNKVYKTLADAIDGEKLM